MKRIDRVFRALVDSALAGDRSWANVADVAWQAGVGESLAYKALSHPASIGAVVKRPGGGLSVVDPERVLMILSARRSLASARSSTFEAVQSMIASLPAYAIGGTRAATHHLGGKNTIADHAPAIVYVPDDADLDATLDRLPAGDSAVVLTADARSMQLWSDGFTSRAQTYADLFAQPGWQASEFRRALWRAWFTVDDWAQAESTASQSGDLPAPVAAAFELLATRAGLNEEQRKLVAQLRRDRSAPGERQRPSLD